MKNLNMNKSIFKTHPIIKMINSSMINLPSPSNISFMWNFGSLLGMMLMIQLITGIFLSMNYCPSINLAFESINHINHNVYKGWLMQILHANGASMFFIMVYLHIGRNMYYDLYMNSMTWFVGIIILLIMMMTAFMGYVLPWGQMSFWGATVITNLLSTIPYVGTEVVQWIWGGFSINNSTLNRFFSIHFILPFVLTVLILVHLIFLHQKGSNNPLNINNKFDKIPFHPYFTLKDLMGFMITITILMMFSLKYPYMLNDNDNFIEANPMSTPPHIQPEWYFLFAYAILRSIPNKMGGVIGLVSSIMILFIMPISFNKMMMGNSMFLFNKILFWSMVNIFIILSWIGSNPVEDPYIMMNQILSTMYFLFFIINPIVNKTWNKLIM
uniref:Cytochrome b n=1 Tax=Melanotrichia acclivopennis TaxID=2904888 RepID=A0A9E8LP11_9NEOP|nr:cytochrome b [Melanotrichia acclivopennis]UZZ44154.1 cytochrome b [Melanotrichia acclivopennis]